MTEKSVKELKKELAKAEKKQEIEKEKDFTKTVLLVIYITTMLIIAMYFYCIIVVQVEPVAIIEWYFKCVIGEVGVLGIIKVVKTLIKKGIK